MVRAAGREPLARSVPAPRARGNFVHVRRTTGITRRQKLCGDAKAAGAASVAGTGAPGRQDVPFGAHSGLKSDIAHGPRIPRAVISTGGRSRFLRFKNVSV